MLLTGVAGAGPPPTADYFMAGARAPLGLAVSLRNPEGSQKAGFRVRLSEPPGWPDGDMLLILRTQFEDCLRAL